MDSSSIQIAGTEIAGFTHTAAEFRLTLSRALVVKTMTGSAEQTLWSQSGELIIGEAELISGSIFCDQTAICERADLDDNQYTYRNMLPIPLESRGRIRLELHLRGHAEPLIAEGATLQLSLHDTPRYIEHMRPKSA